AGPRGRGRTAGRAHPRMRGRAGSDPLRSTRLRGVPAAAGRVLPGLLRPDRLLGTVVMPHRVDVSTAVRDLLATMAANPWGQVSTSVYETGRLAVLAPALPGQAQRLDHLVWTQDASGSWGAPDGYALVPTLSATDALLAALLRDDPAID